MIDPVAHLHWNRAVFVLPEPGCAGEMAIRFAVTAGAFRQNLPCVAVMIDHDSQFDT